jgi:hypothetical protein
VCPGDYKLRALLLPCLQLGSGVHTNCQLQWWHCSASTAATLASPHYAPPPHLKQWQQFFFHEILFVTWEWYSSTENHCTMANPPPTGLRPLTSSKDTAASGHPGQCIGDLRAPMACPAPAPNPQRRGPTPPTGGTPLLSGPQQSPCLGSWPTPSPNDSWVPANKTACPTTQQSPPSGGVRILGGLHLQGLWGGLLLL